VAHRPTPDFPRHLEALYAAFPFDRSLAQDPLSCVRPFAFDPRAAELAGIFASTLAVGNVTSIRHAFSNLLSRAGGDFVTAVESAPTEEWKRRFAPFTHRWIRADQVGFLALRLARLRDSYGSLEDLFWEGMQRNGFAGGLDALARGLRGPQNGTAPRGERPPRGYLQLFPSPLESSRSACKRLTLYLRWMVRPHHPDLGVWRRVPVRELRVPLDQHVYWIAYHLGLTRRKTRNWATVEEVTAALRRIDPDDPVKYDFVLCHTGISGDCPKTKDISICGPCVVRPDCLLWRRGTGG
jgi:uncharacterized protein (TIGR02757 family)